MATVRDEHLAALMEDERFDELEEVVEEELDRRGLRYGVDYIDDDVRVMTTVLYVWTNGGRDGDPYETVETVVDDWLNG